MHVPSVAMKDFGSVHSKQTEVELSQYEHPCLQPLTETAIKQTNKANRIALIKYIRFLATLMLYINQTVRIKDRLIMSNHMTSTFA